MPDIPIGGNRSPTTSGAFQAVIREATTTHFYGKSTTPATHTTSPKSGGLQMDSEHENGILAIAIVALAILAVGLVWIEATL